MKIASRWQRVWEMKHTPRKRDVRFRKVLNLCLLLNTLLIGVPAFAGDISEYANEEWLTGAYPWEQTYVVGCQMADPTGVNCGILEYSVKADTPPWTFEVGSEGATLTVVDAWGCADQYAVYDHGEWVGDTSEPPMDTGCYDNPEDCMASTCSKGVFEMSPGAHSIELWVISEESIAGTVFFRTDGDVIQPVTDTDGDGIVDADDSCPQSDLQSSVVIDGSDCNVENQLLEDGCTMQDRVNECYETCTTRNEERRCLKSAIDAFYNLGVIDKPEWQLLKKCRMPGNR
jgi:hypothetical protein